MTETSNRKKILLQSLNHVGKLIATAVIVVLLLIGAFLIYYVISAKIISKSDGEVPKISLYTIVSGSMTPAIKVYDVIVDVRVDNPSEIKVGDVITFKSTSTISKDMIVTHRVLDVRIVDGKYEYVTKGDYNPTADSDTVKEENLIGKTVLKIPQLGRIQFFLATKMGWFLVVLIPALGVIIYDIVKLFKIMGVKGTSESVEKSGPDIKEYNEKKIDKKIMVSLEKMKKNLIKQEPSNVNTDASDSLSPVDKEPIINEESIIAKEKLVNSDSIKQEIDPREILARIMAENALTPENNDVHHDS